MTRSTVCLECYKSFQIPPVGSIRKCCGGDCNRRQLNRHSHSWTCNCTLCLILQVDIT